MIYLDHNATTPLAPEAEDAIWEAVREFGNPSSIHQFGRKALEALEDARVRLAGCLGVSAESIVLTASGSEANNLTIKGILMRRAGRPSHLVVSAMEHQCVLRSARYMAARFDWVGLTEVNPGPDGRLDPAKVGRAITGDTCLVSVMYANHETGMIQPLAEIAEMAHRCGALLHSDAVQAFGRIPVEPQALGCDLLALAAHKFHGPKGVGALYVGPEVELDPLIHGGSQEGERRAGTQNLPGAVGMATAAEVALKRREDAAAHLRRLESLFLELVREGAGPCELNGALENRIPGVLNLAFEGVAQDDLVVGMDLAGVAISAGSACTSGVIEPSAVLQAMDLPDWRVNGGVRISFGRDSTELEARSAARHLIDLCARLRGGEVLDPPA